MQAYINGIPSKIPFLGRMPLERVHLEAAGHMKGDGGSMDILKHHGNVYSLYLDAPWPLPNVWLGVSAEDQKRANERIPDLLATPAAVRFLSAEPLLGPIDLHRLRIAADHHTIMSALEGYHLTYRAHPDEKTKLDWVIVGGESGKDARPMHPDWARSLRDQCTAACVPFFFKQWGSWGPGAAFAAERSARSVYRGEIQTLSIPGSRDIKLCTPTRDHDRLGPPLTLERYGKKVPGRLLDGIEHNGMPQIGEVPAL